MTRTCLFLPYVSRCLARLLGTVSMSGATGGKRVGSEGGNWPETQQETHRYLGTFEENPTAPPGCSHHHRQDHLGGREKGPG